MADSATRPEVQLFREYLQIPSVHPNVDYSKKIKTVLQTKTLLH